LVLNGAGTFVWAAGFSGVGYLWGERAHALLSALRQFGGRSLMVLAALVAMILLVWIIKIIHTARLSFTHFLRGRDERVEEL
jgi:membrane protein DedA with SNARE-associated domain